MTKHVSISCVSIMQNIMYNWYNYGCFLPMRTVQWRGQCGGRCNSEPCATVQWTDRPATVPVTYI